jgi:hypothetical protein
MYWCAVGLTSEDCFFADMVRDLGELCQWIQIGPELWFALS